VLGRLPTVRKAVRPRCIDTDAADAERPCAEKQRSTVEWYREEIATYRPRGLEAAAIRALLEETHCHPVSYSAVWLTGR